MNHVILEGPDGSGKTTLARTLCRSLGMAYRHEGVPPPKVNRCEYYSRILWSTNQPTVFDRFHLGEVIYGPLLRGESGLTLDGIIAINSTFDFMGGVIICCLPSWETCLANTRSKEEMIKDELVLHAAYDSWSRLVKSHRLFTGRVYNYTKEI